MKLDSNNGTGKFRVRFYASNRNFGPLPADKNKTGWFTIRSKNFKASKDFYPPYYRHIAGAGVRNHGGV